MSVTFDQATDAAKALVLPKLKDKLQDAITSKLGKATAGLIIPAVWPIVLKGVNILLDELKPRVTIEGDGPITGTLTL